MSLGIIAIGMGPVMSGLLSDMLFSGDPGKSLVLVSLICGIVGFVLLYRCRTHYIEEVIDS